MHIDNRVHFSYGLIVLFIQIGSTIMAFLKCGILANGFLRVRCDECHHEKLVAFSCKRRGVKAEPLLIGAAFLGRLRVFQRAKCRDFRPMPVCLTTL